eukprot:GFYU01055883.1.p1 GENE.GFYU01055883.1~~GFYU01055883.1.p1  ORF type:complete len:104 (+),score=5.64 GFYU01055883.1:1-312(+)
MYVCMGGCMDLCMCVNVYVCMCVKTCVCVAGRKPYSHIDMERDVYTSFLTLDEAYTLSRYDSDYVLLASTLWVAVMAAYGVYWCYRQKYPAPSTTDDEHEKQD